MTRVAIQGEAGSYSHDAAVACFGPAVDIVPCRTFRAVFEALAEGRASRAVVPIENTSTEPIHETVELLGRSRVRRAGETRLRVDHCLIVAAGAEGIAESRIRRVASHPVALAQCVGFLRAHPAWETVETADTAGAVRALAGRRISADAVIASRRAAERYGCRVLREAVQDEPANFTTFLALASIESIRPAARVGVPVTSPPGAVTSG
jgi:prephenate dehydratase